MANSSHEPRADLERKVLPISDSRMAPASEAEEAEHLADGVLRTVGAPSGGVPSDKYYKRVVTVIKDDFNRVNPKHEEAHDAVQKANSELRTRKQQLGDATRAESFTRNSHKAVSVGDGHHAPLPRQWAIAGGALIPEWYTCYLAAEALGGGWFSTAIFATVLLVVLAGCEYWYDSAVRSERQSDEANVQRHRIEKRAALSILIATVATLGVLRFYYGWVVLQHSLLGALGVAAALTVVTAALVGIGLAALRLSESIKAWRYRVAHKKAVRTREAAKANLAKAWVGQERAIGQYEQLMSGTVTATARKLITPQHDYDVDEERLRTALRRNLAHDVAAHDVAQDVT